MVRLRLDPDPWKIPRILNPDSLYHKALLFVLGPISVFSPVVDPACFCFGVLRFRNTLYVLLGLIVISIYSISLTVSLRLSKEMLALVFISSLHSFLNFLIGEDDIKTKNCKYKRWVKN